MQPRDIVERSDAPIKTNRLQCYLFRDLHLPRRKNPPQQEVKEAEAEECELLEDVVYFASGARPAIDRAVVSDVEWAAALEPIAGLATNDPDEEVRRVSCGALGMAAGNNFCSP